MKLPLSSYQPKTLLLLRWIGCLLDPFRSFQQYCQFIFDAALSRRRKKKKLTILLLWIGRHGADIYNGWEWSSDSQRYTFSIVWDRFQQHIKPKVNFYLARYHFHQCEKKPDESFDEFISRCRLLAEKCKFSLRTYRRSNRSYWRVYTCGYRCKEKE